VALRMSRPVLGTWDQYLRLTDDRRNADVPKQDWLDAVCLVWSRSAHLQLQIGFFFRTDRELRIEPRRVLGDEAHCVDWMAVPFQQLLPSGASWWYEPRTELLIAPLK